MNTIPEMDDRWIKDWFEFGWSELERYLRVHAKFEQYLTAHGLA